MDNWKLKFVFVLALFGASLAQAAYVPFPVTSGANKERVERIRIDYSGSTPIITSQSGSWVSSVTGEGTGIFLLTFNSGIFSAIPSCVCTPFTGGVNHQCSTLGNISPSNTQMEFITSQGSTGLNDAVFIICMGPR